MSVPLQRWLLLVILCTGACLAPSVDRGTAIDQSPMYGGLDRSSSRKFKAEDERLIADTTRAFGSRQIASEMFVLEAFQYLHAGNLATAMRRFNQAWLLSPENPDVFWGFAAIFETEGKPCEAKEYMDRALGKGLAKPLALGAAGSMYSLCGALGADVAEATKLQYFRESEALFERAAAAAAGNDRLYELWASALYQQGQYARAWDMIEKVRAVGGSPDPYFLKTLRDKLAVLQTPQPQPH